jgi:hypothetical protein
MQTLGIALSALATAIVPTASALTLIATAATMVDG